jgi:hypothetical protein
LYLKNDEVCNPHLFNTYFIVAVSEILLQALLDYERHNIKGGELNVPIASPPEPVNVENQVM